MFKKERTESEKMQQELEPIDDEVKDNVNNFFKWVKGTELVELDDIDVSEDPVRPELDLD